MARRSRRSGSRKPAKGRIDTRLAHSGRDADLTRGGVNPVVQRASTVVIESADKLFEPGSWTYGRHGTATHEALKHALAELEEAEHCVLAASGLMACVLPMLALASPGGHALMTDTAYGPTRRFADRLLRRWGCEVDYFDPHVGPGIQRLLRPETRLVFLESPGSMTFEIHDTPAIAAAARHARVPTVMDNTWSGGVFHKPLALGVDISVHACTKYVSGGADVLNGAILTNRDDLFQRLKETTTDLGGNVSADDAYLVLRGLRTLPVRMKQHEASALAVARWLEGRREVVRVIHPALESEPDHTLWRRDFTGASGLFSFVMQPAPTRTVHAFLDALELFSLGFSYGGFESLAIHCDPQLKRTASRPDLGGPLIRLSIGLEDPDDLIADLDQAFARAATA